MLYDLTFYVYVTAVSVAHATNSHANPASEPETSLGRSPKSRRRNERACTAMNCSLIVERENSGLNVVTVKYAIMSAPVKKGERLFATCVPATKYPMRRYVLGSHPSC